MMVDSGAAFTCIRPEDAIHLPMSGQWIRTIGFEGVKQLIPLTEPTELCYKDQKITIPILVSEHTPIPLLGRDALCKLNCTIKCTPDGCLVEMPNDVVRQLLMTTEDKASTVFWIGNLSADFLEPARLWEKFIIANLPNVRPPEYPFHCTLKYFKDTTKSNPEEWLSRQPEWTQLRSCCIILGPQGASMKVDKNDYIQKEFDVESSVPHVTLWVSEEYEQKHIGQMMLEAEEAVFMPLKENHAIWISEDQRFIKLMITAQGQGQPQTVKMMHEAICSAQEDFDPKREKMLREVPECLWSQHSTDIGLVKSAQPVRVELRQGVKLPWKSQYPLKEEAIRGIEPQIEGLLKAGVLKITQNPQCNTPLLPVKKPDGTYRLVHDLRAVNEVVADFPAEASSVTMGYPMTILTHHSLRNLLNYGKYVLTMPRLRDYYRLLEQEDVTLARCVTVNPAENLPTSEDGEPHDCVQEAERYSKLRQKKEEVQERLDEQKRDTIQPGDKVFVKVFRRKWYNERREGPFEVVRSTGTAVQVKGSPTWYHFSHCVKAPSDELPCSQSHDEGSRQSEETAERCEEVEMHTDFQSQISEGEIVHGVDDVADVVYISDDARSDSAVNGQERRFGDIDFQYVPETAEPISVECEASKGTKGSNSATGAFGGSVRRRSPRPVRKRVRPKRYEN
ncbi:hypothetical protein MHYP_G00194030 [Metynnis hypsauchen]